MQPDLNGALFVERRETKKREWKAEKSAQINFIIKKITRIRFGKIIANKFSNKNKQYEIFPI
ncbi:hypothetical protein OA86_07805 [Kaistella jeonii]|uniref:Uncharacterized protein n=1 Tax=Kaistella jeonii TaxID=266749 RepID=A0A0C1F6Z9_9FLAO|nr:hypothetical protein OA86_07805 [Kaistella jeonii]